LLRVSPTTALAVLTLTAVICMAVGAHAIAPHDPARVQVERRLKPPAWAAGGSPLNPLGTDSLGRDVLSRVIYGSRISLTVGIAVVLISGTFGVMSGLLSGYFGGRLDDFIMRLSDVQLAFPFLLLAIAVLAVLGPGIGNVILVLAVWSWVAYARVVRGQVLALREKDFVEAVRAVGAGTTRILFRHILPNTWAPIIVMASFAMANTILAEGSLSFLGLGVPPSVPTWGGILAEGREYISVAWWIVTFPGLALMITVLCINVIGDWLRDYLDPRVRL
jgi:peptide/nickel transport system permease protein